MASDEVKANFHIRTAKSLRAEGNVDAALGHEQAAAALRAKKPAPAKKTAAKSSARATKESKPAPTEAAAPARKPKPTKKAAAPRELSEHQKARAAVAASATESKPTAEKTTTSAVNTKPATSPRGVHIENIRGEQYKAAVARREGAEARRDVAVHRAAKVTAPPAPASAKGLAEARKRGQESARKTVASTPEELHRIVERNAHARELASLTAVDRRQQAEKDRADANRKREQARTEKEHAANLRRSARDAEIAKRNHATAVRREQQQHEQHQRHQREQIERGAHAIKSLTENSRHIEELVRRHVH